MAKRFSIINYVLVSILVAIGIFLSVCSFKIPFYVNDFASFAGAITLGYDVGEGQTGVFELKPTSSEVTSFNDKQMNDKLKFITDVVSNFNGDLYQIGLQNNNQIRINIIKDDTSSAFMNAIANRTEIVLRGEETDSKTEFDIPASFIKKCIPTYQPTGQDNSSYSFGVYIEFNDLGKAKLEALTNHVKDGNKTIYFYNANGEKINSVADISKKNTSGAIFLPDQSLKTEADTKMYAVNIMMGACDAKFNILENNTTTAFVGYNSLTYIVITLAIVFVLIAVFMITRYRDLGLLAMFSGLINVVLYLFLLQALPIVTLTISGIIGCVLGFCMTMLAHVIIFENIKKEYKNGRKISLSFKLGFKNSLFNIIDLSAITGIASIILYFIGYSVLKSFAIAMFIGSLLTMFSSLVVTRGFTKWYLPLNSTNAKHLNLKREATNDEE